IRKKTLPGGARTESVTRPREWIASILAGEPRFLSASQIYERTKRQGLRVSLSTIYRTLERLHAKGDGTARTQSDGEATYMLCEPARHHHHAICRRCGRVEDVDCSVTDRFAQSLRPPHAFEIGDHAMEIF